MLTSTKLRWPLHWKVYFLKLHMCMYLRTKFRFLGIILTSFRQGVPFPYLKDEPGLPSQMFDVDVSFVVVFISLRLSTSKVAFFIKLDERKRWWSEISVCMEIASNFTCFKFLFAILSDVVFDMILYQVSATSFVYIWYIVCFK